MYWLVAFISLNLVALVAYGLHLERRRPTPPRWARKGVVLQLVLFVLAEIGLLAAGVGEALAQTPPAAGTEVSLGFGLAMIGVALPTGLATLAAGIAIGPVASSALAVIAEKPEAFGRTLVYLGLAEGVAIYGLVVSILMLGKL